jgi:hypothetical protein
MVGCNLAISRPASSGLTWKHVESLPKRCHKGREKKETEFYNPSFAAGAAARRMIFHRGSRMRGFECQSALFHALARVCLADKSIPRNPEPLFGTRFEEGSGAGRTHKIIDDSDMKILSTRTEKSSPSRRNQLKNELQ